jgi:hypothetical protein
MARVPGARGFDPPAWARKRVGEAVDLLGGQSSRW